MKKLLVFCGAAMASLLLASCFKTPDTNSLSRELVVATDRDLNVNFSSYSTYHISDTIPRITNDPTDTIITGPEAEEIVNRIKERLNARGYTFVERSANPDLAVIPAVVRVTNVGTSCTGWWGGYPGYWPPGYWRPGYGYYYPYCGIYSFETGSLNIDMLDLVNAPNNNNISATWTAVLFGSLNSSDAVNLDRALNGVDQAFDQSPYITK
ncbi:MAG: DUF4136 domain-containing protein [Maribacter sp.]|nr:DUF4136 domain-containing protein [Maribacter sp.]